MSALSKSFKLKKRDGDARVDVEILASWVLDGGKDDTIAALLWFRDWCRENYLHPDAESVRVSSRDHGSGLTTIKANAYRMKLGPRGLVDRFYADDLGHVSYSGEKRP